MQYDVKSVHATTAGLILDYRTRLKGAIISANATAATRNTVFADNTPQSGTYSIPTSTTCTVTIVNHGLSNGDRVWLNFTSGTAVDNVYTVTVTGDDTFTVTTASLTTSGNVTMYANILLEVDSYNPTAFNVIVPGEGILVPTGLFVGVVANVTATVFYG
jgi:S-formylglutathione hydrolase FrmB